MTESKTNNNTTGDAGYPVGTANGTSTKEFDLAGNWIGPIIPAAALRSRTGAAVWGISSGCIPRLDLNPKSQQVRHADY